MDTDPSEQGHERLKKGKHARNETDLAPLHFGFAKSVGKGDGEGVHRQTDAEQGAVREKQEIHESSPPKKEKSRAWIRAGP